MEKSYIFALTLVSNIYVKRWRQVIRIGIDIGSTTVKTACFDSNDKLIFKRYVRHNARISETVCEALCEIPAGDENVSIAVTGSIGMGVAERCGFPFVQEVVAAAKAIRSSGLRAETLIDIGGEDAKVVFFDKDGSAVDMRMNGNCAGGTGAFIDQMALILGEDISRLSDLALSSERVYPIASRCGVFCKTDIQNLIAKNVCKEDIAASIFHAVAVQTVVTLAHGCEIRPPVVFCGGPLTYIPALRKAFMEYLHFSSEDVLEIENGGLLPAIGCALSAPVERTWRLSDLVSKVRTSMASGGPDSKTRPLFESEEHHRQWLEGLEAFRIKEAVPSDDGLYLGIDSGSTTTKIVILDRSGNMVYSYYHANDGDPVGAVRRGLSAFSMACAQDGLDPVILGGCSTGYGEDLIKAAFRLDTGIVETMAHFEAARKMDPEVSFILDIGGQDMKAIYVSAGVIGRIEINEACSSGCGSFIETFARSLGYSVSDFAALACTSLHPCDLGTRCTVFMNSKVKEVLREGYGVADIAAGLSMSVIRNCLYKVLKITDVSTLGTHIAVQGGTMKNDSVVRALEVLTGCRVMRSSHPELMGAYGCALHAMRNLR